MNFKTTFYSYLFVTIAIIVVVFASLSMGAMKIPVLEVLSVLFSDTAGVNNTVVIDMRLPRILSALVVGAALGASGAVMQAIFRNPLADPTIIGISNGSALFVVLAIATLPMYMVNMYTMPVFAFIGGLVTTFIVYRIGTIGGKSSSLFLILGGVAIGILSAAIIGFASYVADDMQLRQISVWQMGSIVSANWILLTVTVGFMIPGMFVLIYMARQLDIYSLGEYECRDLGVNPQTVKNICIVTVALAIGASIALAGPIGFIGLVVPHIVRLTGSVNNRRVIPLSALGGGLFLLVCDTIARTIALPMDIPVGLVTGVPGGLLFIWLIISRAKKYSNQ